MRYKKELLQLRNDIPIGFQQGITLLENSNGDITKALQEFILQLSTQFSKKNNLTLVEAEEILQTHDYSVIDAQKEIEDLKTSIIEKIVQRKEEKRIKDSH